ncbi:proteasome activator subunit 4, partial [Tanacetum coccineum]
HCTKAVAEFRRTHADTWSVQKDSFTEEHLEVLADGGLVMSVPYCQWHTTDNRVVDDADLLVMATIIHDIQLFNRVANSVHI